MPLTHEKRLDSNFANNNDNSYLHKKFKKMASTISILPANGETRQRDANVQSSCDSSIPNGSIAAAHPEIEKIKEIQKLEFQNLEKNVQTSYNDENCRISSVNNIVNESGQTSYTDEFSNKTENLENDLVKDAYNGGTGGRYICVYCKLSCAKPSVLQKHIRAHTNERPYPCVPCGFAFKTKSNLYKHRRSRTHALRMQGADVSAASINEEDLSGGSESDTSIPPASISDAGSDIRIESRPNEFSSPELMNDNISPSINAILASGENNRTKGIYKPKFRGAFYQENHDKDKTKKNISYGDFLTEHISKIISDNEAIIDVIETPLQKKYGKIKQIAESKQFQNETNDFKLDSTPLNLTKTNETDNSFRKRSHSESFSQFDYQKHPLNPEGSIIKNLLLKNKANGMASVQNENTDSNDQTFACPLCQIIYRSADNLEIHRLYYCKGATSNSIVTKDAKVGRGENIFVRSNSVNVRLPETSYPKTNGSNKTLPLKIKPDNLLITQPESNVAAPLPSPGPLLGNTRLVDTRSDNRKMDYSKIKHTLSPKRKFDSRSETYSPRLTENMSPLCSDVYSQPKIRCMESNTQVLRPLDDLSPHIRHNSLQMFGGEVKIVHHSGTTTTLRIEPSKNQLSPILIQHNMSPTKLGDSISNVVVRSGLHSGGTIVHNPPTPKEILTTPKPQTPRITISTAPVISKSNLHDIPHFQFPPLSAITAFNPLTLPPLSPSPTPNGPTTILHGGKLIPHVPGIPGPNTPGGYVGTPQGQTKAENNHSLLAKHSTSAKYEIARNSKSPNVRIPIDCEKQNLIGLRLESHHHNTASSLITKPKNVAESQLTSKAQNISKARTDTGVKRNSDGLPRTPIIKENHYQAPIKIKEKYNTYKSSDVKLENEVRHFNFENLITKTEIFNNQIPSSSDVQKNTNVQEALPISVQNERSETFYFQKSSSTKSGNDERRPKFLRPSTLPLKIGTFTPKRHHGITPNANTMPLVSPETPRPAKAYGQLYLNGNAYTYLGLKCSTKVFYCTINRPQPTYVPNQHFLSMYSNWQLLSELTPDPLGLSASSAMSLYDSRHRPQSVTIALFKQDLILTHSSQWNKNSRDYYRDNKQMISALDAVSQEDKLLNSDSTSTAKKELAGGFESNEEYTYVRGRGRGRYVCSECGIRCKKPSMLKKHIRTHTDVRPYTCIHCAFSFKTKGNLTKHMKSKAHYKKCCELGINPSEGTEGEVGEMTQCSGETDDDTESDGDEGNEGETESSDTEAYKSRLPEHEAAHCLLSLGGSRNATSTNPGLITSARPTTYPYTPTGLESTTLELNTDLSSMTRSSSADLKSDVDNEPMDLSRSDAKAMTTNIPEIPTARESSVLASLASNTAKLPQHPTEWTNGEPMLHTYLTERALLDTKIKQSQLTSNLSKLRKIDVDKSIISENATHNVYSTSTMSLTTSVITTSTTIISTKVSSLNNADNASQSLLSSTDERLSDDPRDPPVQVNTETDLKMVRTASSSNAENAKHVVSEYLKHAKISQTKTHDDNSSSQTATGDDFSSGQFNTDENTMDDSDVTDSETVKLPTEHDTVARKVVIGVGGVAFKVTKGKEFEGSSSLSPGRLMEDGRRVCDFCNKTFTKPSQLRLHLNIHYMERPFRCSVCAVSFRTRGHLQKHERSGSHHNKVSMTSTFGTATTFNPRPFRCSDCNIAFRIHGHLAKHLRSKMHVMRLECLFKLPFGTFTEIERAGVSLTDIDTTDCASSLTSLQNLARKLHEKDPTSLEYREPSNAVPAPAGRDSSEDEDGAPLLEQTSECKKGSDTKTNENSDVQNVRTQVNLSATDI